MFYNNKKYAVYSATQFLKKTILLPVVFTKTTSVEVKFVQKKSK